MSARVAIYAAPGIVSTDTASTDAASSTDAVGSLLRERAERWLGRRIDGGEPAPDLPDGWSREVVDDLTVDARRYGFHGTLKAPFRLADGCTLEQLADGVARFAASRSAAMVPQVSVDRIGSFFALVPGADAPELRSLADAVVSGFEAFRAPTTEAEIARRDPRSLTSRQRELLERWGYPYVFDEFRFHLTLTDSVPSARRHEVHEALSGWFAECIGQSVAVDALAVFTESAPGAPFQLHSVHPLQPRPHTHAHFHPGTDRVSDALDHEGTR